jgi:hypothetical protein
MKLLIRESSPASPHFLLDPDILLITLFSNTLNLCSSLSARDQVSHPYKATWLLSTQPKFLKFLFHCCSYETVCVLHSRQSQSQGVRNDEKLSRWGNSCRVSLSGTLNILSFYLLCVHIVYISSRDSSVV